MIGRATGVALLWLIACTAALAQAEPGPSEQRGIIRFTPGQTYTERPDIPGTSQEQQEAELAAQRRTGCSTKPLDPKTLALLEPYLNGLIAQSDYASTHVGRIRHTPSTDAEWKAVSRDAMLLESKLDALYRDHSPAADRALVYLLRFRFLYAEFADDSIDCELAQRAGLTPPRRAAVRPTRAKELQQLEMRKLLKRIGQCLPLTGREPYPHQMVLPMEEVRRRIRELPNACERHVDEWLERLSRRNPKIPTARTTRRALARRCPPCQKKGQAPD